MDGSICLHDHRDLKRTVAVFSSKSNGHTQVRINSKSPVLVASAHAGYLLIWDLRNPKKPLSSIIAHVSNKVGKFDWGQQTSADQIVTCSPMESEVKSWKVRAARMDVPPTPVSSLKFSSLVSSALMSPSGVLVLTAHSDARIRLSPLPKPGSLEDAPKESYGDSSQKISQCLLSFSTGSPVERRVDVANVLPGMAPGPDGTAELRVMAVTSPVGACAPMLREWLITSQAATVKEQTAKAGGSATVVGGWRRYVEDQEEEGEAVVDAQRADLWDGQQLPVGIYCTPISAGTHTRERTHIRHGVMGRGTRCSTIDNPVPPPPPAPLSLTQRCAPQRSLTYATGYPTCQRYTCASCFHPGAARSLPRPKLCRW